jgi:hypothetical protein
MGHGGLYIAGVNTSRRHLPGELPGRNIFNYGIHELVTVIRESKTIQNNSQTIEIYLWIYDTYTTVELNPAGLAEPGPIIG